MLHRSLGGITTFGPLWYEGSQTFCSLQNECYFFMMLEETWEKIFFCTFTHCASHFQNLLCTCLKNMKKIVSILQATETRILLYNFTVCKCTDRNERMGREAEGEGMGGEWRREEERRKEKKRRKEYRRREKRRLLQYHENCTE